MAARHIACVAAAPNQHGLRAGAEIEDRDLRLVEAAGRGGDRVQHGLPARQYLRPEMVGFAARPVRPSQHGRRAACGGDPLQARRHIGGSEDDRAVRAPARAAGCAVGAAEDDRWTAGDRDLLQCGRGGSIEDADPLAVRRDERSKRRAEPAERRGVELIERAHEECRAVGADVDEARAIRREGQVAKEPAHGRRRGARRSDQEARHARWRNGGTRGEPDGGARHRDADEPCAGRYRHAPPRWSWRDRRCDRRRTRGIVEDELRDRDVSDALPAIFREAPTDQRSNGCWHVGGDRSPVRFALEDRRNRVRHCLAGKRGPTGQHLVEHTAERPDVGSFVDGQSPRLLGTHVSRRAEDEASLRRKHAASWRVHHIYTRAACGVEGLRQPEVQHLHRAVLADLDVRRLQVPMNDPLLVRGFEGLGDLRRHR